MGKFVGIDFGEKRIGLAISSDSNILAFPIGLVEAGKTLDATVDILIAFLHKHVFDAFVIGLPLHMNGKDSDMSLKVRELAKLLEEKSQKKVFLWDERLSSKEVERRMIEGEVKRKNRSKHVDTLAATLILQNYLDSKSLGF